MATRNKTARMHAPQADPRANQAASASSPGQGEGAGRRPRLGYLIFTVLATGGGIMMLEVLGARVAGPIFGVSLFIWTALIAITLVSLSIGYWLGGVVSDSRPRADMMYGLILAGGALIAFIPFFDSRVMVFCYEALGLRVGVLASAFILFAPPLTLLGMISPYAIKLALADLRRAGRVAGTLYAISTLGSVAGTVVTGYWLIPLLGLAATMRVITVVVLTPAILWFVLGRRWDMVSGGALALAAGMALAFLPKDLPAGTTVLSCRDGLYGQIKVIENNSYGYGGQVRWLLLEGTAQTGVYVDSNETVSNYVQVIADFLKFHPPAGRSALLIGLGGGALLRPLIEQGYAVDVVEIDPLVANAAAEYMGADPATYNLIVADGRAYIRYTDQRYDVVLFDVFSGGGQPFHLFSREMFKETKRILTPDGLLGLNAIGFPEGAHAEMIHSLYKTISTEFDHGRVFVGYPDDSMEELNNVLMFFAPAPFHEVAPDELPEADDIDYIAWDQLQKSEIQLKAADGVIVTDDRNPVDRWTAQVNEVWRDRLFKDMGPAILAYD